MKRGELVDALLFLLVLAAVGLFWLALHEIDSIHRGVA